MLACDLEAYFAHIGFEGPRNASLETLKALHGLHPQAIAFENLDPLMGRPVMLDLESLLAKLVAQKRGGYCFEHNTLLEAALRELGFDVKALAARVAWNNPPGVVAPRTHMLLEVSLPQGRYIADVGFGGLTLTAPLRLEADLVQETPHGVFRLARDDQAFELQVRLGDEWAAIYRFSLEYQEPADRKIANWYTSTHPDALFTHSLIAARVAGDRRYGLLNTDLSIRHADGRAEKHKLETPAQLFDVLGSAFGIAVPEGDGEALAKLFPREG